MSLLSISPKHYHYNHYLPPLTSANHCLFYSGTWKWILTKYFHCIIMGKCLYFNPFMPIVFSHPYQLDDSISNFRVVGRYFLFHSNFSRHFCKKTVDSLIRRRVLRRLIWFRTDCRCPTKRTLGVYDSRLWCLVMSLLLSHWYPGSGVVLDCIDSWSLPSFLLKVTKSAIMNIFRKKIFLNYICKNRIKLCFHDKSVIYSWKLHGKVSYLIKTSVFLLLVIINISSEIVYYI